MDQTRKSLEFGRVKALGHIYHEVDRLNSQISMNKRGDTFKAEQLMEIVENHLWAQEAKKKLLQGNVKFAGLYSELSASALLWEETIKKQGLDPETAHDFAIRNTPSNQPSTVFFGARYARPVSSFRRRRDRKIKTFKRKGASNRANSHCYRCGKLGHYAFECSDSNRITMANAIRSRIRNTDYQHDRAAAEIIFELATQLDDVEIDYLSDSDKELAENTFETLLSSSAP